VNACAATEPGSDVPNEDWYGCLPNAVVVLDGVTVRPGIESGCVHGTPWYVRQLGLALISGLCERRPPADVLARSIAMVAALHAGTCDLDTIGAPSAAVGMLRAAGGLLEWLVLADVSIAIETADGDIRVISDNRVAESVTGLDSRSARLGERIGAARAANRNRAGGYWVAAADPAAAWHAVTGSAPLADTRRVVVATDGAARMVDLFGGTWRRAFDIGPAGVIRQVRSMERRDEACERWPRMKAADDATAVLWKPQCVLRPGRRAC
jgi:hypothetical protein